MARVARSDDESLALATVLPGHAPTPNLAWLTFVQSAVVDEGPRDQHCVTYRRSPCCRSCASPRGRTSASYSLPRAGWAGEQRMSLTNLDALSGSFLVVCVTIGPCFRRDDNYPENGHPVHRVLHRMLPTSCTIVIAPNSMPIGTLGLEV